MVMANPLDLGHGKNHLKNFGNLDLEGFFFQGTLKAQLSKLLKIGYYTSKTVLFKLNFSFLIKAQLFPETCVKVTFTHVSWNN